VYQLQGYKNGRLRQLARTKHDIAVIDLARDAGTDYFHRKEIKALRKSGKKVLAYFEIGSIENFRPEYPVLLKRTPDLVLNQWDEWPEEYFVKYWTARWWYRVLRPRVQQALDAGYDGVYLDTPLAYEEIPRRLARHRTRTQLGRLMAHKVERISRYAKHQRPDFLVVPQNSPELRAYKGYTDAIDGLGVEELFYRATDRRCDRDWCKENRENVRKLRDAGKFVLAVDYVKTRAHVRRACSHYEDEGFIGYATVVDLDVIKPPCPQ
jgi:cysteinyl-tRNA synthetase